MNVITWVNPCFLDYRVPVYVALDDLCDHRLSVIFSDHRVPKRVQQKIRAVLGERAVALSNEHLFTTGGVENDFANTKFLLSFQPRLMRGIRATHPSVIVAEGFFQWTTAALWLRISRGIPLVITYERTAHTERHAGRLRTAYRRLVCRFADAICCNGQLSKEYCIETLRFAPERIVTGAMAADTEVLGRRCEEARVAEATRLRERLVLQSPVFLFVGRLIRPKGLRELLEGWALHLEACPATPGSLLLVGDGRERPELEGIVREKGLRSVHFAGGVDYDAIAPYYAAADVFVMPTLEDNWSLVVPEAMACGLPVLCSMYNGCWPELVRPENGLLFDPLKPREIAQALTYCIKNRAKLAEMGAASRRIVGEFSPEHAARAVMAACRLALKRRERLGQ